MTDFSENLPWAAKKTEWFCLALLIPALLLTLLEGEWQWGARIGWMLLAILFTMNRLCIYCALFFFAPWFHSTGFMTNLFFSLKHFHVAFFLALIVQAIDGSLLKALPGGFRSGRGLYSIILILAIGVINFLRFSHPIQSLRTPANILLTLAILIYLFGLLDSFGTEKSKTVRYGVMFFFSAVVVQVFIALQNTLAGTLYLGTPLVHNNHIGILCAFSSFYGLGLFLTEKNGFPKNLFACAALITISATIASCSRTSWLSFLFCLCCFLILIYRYQCVKSAAVIRKRHALVAFLILTILVFSISMINPIVCERVKNLPQLLDGAYWRYTLNDFQNFGFLGIFRLQQIYDLKSLLYTQPILGVGFIKNLVDFHGLYFCLLGASGMIGLLLFSDFVRRVLNQLFEQIKIRKNDDLFFLRLASFCALLTWLLCSFLESYFVQFSPWIAIFLAMTFGASDSPARGKNYV